MPHKRARCRKRLRHRALLCAMNHLSRVRSEPHSRYVFRRSSSCRAASRLSRDTTTDGRRPALTGRRPQVMSATPRCSAARSSSPTRRTGRTSGTGWGGWSRRPGTATSCLFIRALSENWRGARPGAQNERRVAEGSSPRDAAVKSVALRTRVTHGVRPGFRGAQWAGYLPGRASRASPPSEPVGATGRSGGEGADEAGGAECECIFRNKHADSFRHFGVGITVVEPARRAQHFFPREYADPAQARAS